MSATFNRAVNALQRQHRDLFQGKRADAERVVLCVLQQLADPPLSILDAGTRSTAHWLNLPMRGVALRRAKMNIRWNAMVKAIIARDTVEE